MKTEIAGIKEIKEDTFNISQISLVSHANENQELGKVIVGGGKVERVWWVSKTFDT